MKISVFLYFFLSFLLPALCFAQTHDTLSSVKVIAKRDFLFVTSPTPIQTLNTEDASKTNSNSVADALKHFAGVVVKDFGGSGGLKTVSVRSLGANHTGILYDGIALGNAQAGQVDLGKFSLDNIKQIELHNSVPADILSTAKAFSYASVLLLKTTTGLSTLDTVDRLNVKLQHGSFGYYSPSLYAQKWFGNGLSIAFSTQYQQALSNFPFINFENNASKNRRLNSDLKTFRNEIDAVYQPNNQNAFSLKSYYYNSKRGLPGAIILYNDISNQRLNEREVFFQGSWKSSLSQKSELLFNTKYQSDKSYYLDPTYLNNFGKLENEFYQKEIYFSLAYSYKLSKDLKLSYATDNFSNKLTRKDIFAENFATPTRNSTLNNLAFQFKKSRFEVTGNVLYNIIREKVKVGESANDFNRFSNAVALSVQPFKNLPLRTRIFYKNIFRAPTFNDLYYTNVGNTKLRPEFAKQYNFGFTYDVKPSNLFKRISFTADAYYNEVNDKILALPRLNLFQWSAQNIGRVSIKGVDVALHTVLTERKFFIVSADATYTFQNAIDVTDAGSPMYKTQLPYTPKHNGGATINVLYKQFAINYNLLFSSLRYRAGDQIFENVLQPFSTSDFSFSYLTNKKDHFNYKLIFEANNVFNTQYQIIKYYPMPMINYRITVHIFLKNKTSKNEF